MARDPHAFAREHGPSGVLYRGVRAVAGAILRLWFRPRMTGAEHIPQRGPVILVANHKSFLDAFFIGLATRRQVRFMAKAELFRGPLGPLFLRLGAFPVNRGAGDTDAFETCLHILSHDGLLVLFPEGTRVDDADALGAPHHGAARLALQTGAPIVPAAISGTARLWLGPVPKPRRVRLAFLPPVDASGLGTTPDALDELLDRRVWPAVQQEYGRLRATPGLIAAGLAAAGIGAGFLARRQQKRSATPRLLGKLQPRRLRRRTRRHALLGRLHRHRRS